MRSATREDTLLRTPFILLPLALALVVFEGSVAAQSPLSQPTQARWWRGKFADAFVEAKLRNVPVLIVIIQDGEEANERVVEGVLSHKSFVALTENTVPIICSRMDHDTKAQQIDGRTLHVCTKFGHLACSTHRRQEAVMYRTLFGGKQLSTPQVMIMLPDQTVVDQVTDVAGPAAYAGAVKKAVKKIGRGLSRRAFVEAEKALSSARTALANNELGSAWRHAEQLIAMGGKSSLAATGEALKVRISEAIDRKLKGVVSSTSEKSIWSSLELCQQLGKQLKGTPLGARLKKAERRLKSSKAGRAVASKMKRQSRLIPKWETALAALDRSDYQKAYRAFAFIAEKGQGTPVGSRAVERLETLENDADLSTLLAGLIAERRAKTMLTKARSFLPKKAEEGRRLLQAVIKKFPGTSAAGRARLLLEG